MPPPYKGLQGWTPAPALCLALTAHCFPDSSWKLRSGTTTPFFKVINVRLPELKGLAFSSKEFPGWSAVLPWGKGAHVNYKVDSLKPLHPRGLKCGLFIHRLPQPKMIKRSPPCSPATDLFLSVPPLIQYLPPPTSGPVWPSLPRPPHPSYLNLKKASLPLLHTNEPTTIHMLS